MLTPEQQAKLNADFGFGAPAAASAAPPPTSKLTPAQVQELTAQHAPKQPPNAFVDVGKSTASGLAEGVVGLPGIIGSMGQAADYVSSLPTKAIVRGGGYLAKQFPEAAEYMPKVFREPDKFLNTLSEFDRAMQSPAERSGDVNYVMGVPMPTSQFFQRGAHELGMPSYQPQTEFGRIAKAGAEAIPSGLLLNPGGAFLRAASGGLGGAGGQAAYDLLASSPNYAEYADAGRLAGSLVGGLAPYGAGKLQAFSSPEMAAERGLNIAGQVRREAFPDPAQATREIQGGLADVRGGRYLPDVNLTTAQLLGSGLRKNEKALENEVATLGRQGSAAETANLENQMAASEQARASAAARLAEERAGRIGTTDMEAAARVPPGGQAGASQGTAEAMEALHTRLEAAERANWNSLRNMGVEAGRGEVVSGLRDYIRGLGENAAAVFPKWIVDRVEGMASRPEATIDFQALQDLRSLALAQARKVKDSAEPMLAKDINGFAQKIDEIVGDQNNIVLKSSIDPADEAAAIQKWRDARAATRQRYDLFGEGTFPGKALETAPTEVIGQMLSGRNAVTNLRQVRSLPGVNVDNHVADWMVGQLTRNGFDITPEKINSFLNANGGRMGVIADEVPGLRGRLSELSRRAGESVEQAAARQASASLSAAAGRDPKTLAEYLERNGDALKQAMPYSQHQFIDQLQETSRALSATGPAPLTGRQTLDLLKNNDILTLLYGKAIGKVTENGIAATVGELAGPAMLGVPPGTASAVVGMVGGKKLFAPLIDAAQKLIVGTTQEQAIQALQRASRDPEFAAMLMARPSPERINSIIGALASGATKYGVTTGAVQLPNFAQDDRNRAYGGRAAYRSGGRILDHASKADALVRAAETARKAISGTTEPLLDLPDEHVVKALAVAGEAI